MSSEEKSCIFWLSGWPGTGKSAIARTTARKFDEQGCLAASFFFSRGGGDSSHAGLFVTSIVRQLAECSALNVRHHIRESLGDSPAVAQSLQDQWTKLVLQPLSRYEKSWTSNVFLCVVDALDECEDQRSIGTLLQLLPRLGELVNVRIKILVTSRPELPIRHGFRRMGKSAHHDFVLHNISPEVTDRDIQVFLKYKLSDIALECCLPSDWPSRQILALMVQHAQGLFIWAETACRFIGEEALLAEERLDFLMDRGSGIVAGPERHLDQIYTAILNASVPRSCSGHEQEMVYSHLRLVLGAITVLFSTLSAKALGELLDVSTLKVLQTIAKLHSILDVPDNIISPLRLHHDSFRHFLVDERRCRDHQLVVSVREAHASVATGCIKVMRSTLREDICSQRAPGVLLSDIDEDLVKGCLSEQIRYACLYWVSHLARSEQRMTDDGDVHDFLRNHILHWIETMSWMGKISEAINAIASLEVMTKNEGSAEFHALAYDAKRFLLYARSGIEQAPLQTYISAALFAPSKSVVRQLLQGTALVDYVKRSPRVPEHWHDVLLVLEGHSEWVTALQFSPDGSKLASAAYDRKVVVWDATTGAQLHILEGHSDWVKAVQFSPDGSKLVSVPNDGNVFVWNSATGAQLHTLKSHSDWLCATQFSPDSSNLASVSRSGRLIVWDLATGEQQYTLQDQSYWATDVQFSPNGSKLASAFHDGKITVWDSITGARQYTLESHSGWVSDVQFSPDGGKLASASSNGNIVVWDSISGIRQRTLEGHSAWVNAVQFSPDGSKLASASRDRSVVVWDLNTNMPIEVIDVESYVADLAFSVDGSYLVTDIGSFELKIAVARSQRENACSLHLRTQKEWIFRYGHKVIWLPPEFRPYGRTHAFSGEFMGFGHVSSSVSLWRISG